MGRPVAGASMHDQEPAHHGALDAIYDDAVAHHDTTIAGHGIEAFAPAKQSPLVGLIGTGVSLALLGAVALEVRGLHWGAVEAMIPHTPLFWVVFVVGYLVPPVLEWVIYHRLWDLPVSGLAALMRKTVSNELLLGYLGEVQFYAWVRGRLNDVVAPFGAIKDTTILSALTGNLATLVMLVPVWHLVAGGQMGIAISRVVMALGVVLVTSLAILLFRQKIFTLPRPLLVWIAGVHVVRIVAVVLVTALLWHTVLPGVAIGLWLVLATVRMLLSRLPLLPNKDVVFAGLAVFLLGRDAAVADLMAMMAGIQLVAHLCVGGTLAVADIVTTRVGFGRVGFGRVDPR